MQNCRGCGGKTLESSHYKKNLSLEVIEKTKKHPCYNKDAHDHSRMHLPVAPACNIQCKFCNRKFDCTNESRPGVTSSVLTPEEALASFNKYYDELGNLSVMGIAGPGDPLANFERTLETIRLIRDSHPDVALCLSTNGLRLPDYALTLKNNGITHLTVTMTALDPEIGAQIYENIKYRGKVLTGVEAAQQLIKNQLEGLSILKDLDIMCKVNIVAIKGVNDHHIPEIVREVKKRGVTYTNIMSLIPVKDTAFENHPVMSAKELGDLRKECSGILDQMYHCRQCRADAVGRLKDEKKERKVG